MAATPVVAVLPTHLFVAHRGSLSLFLHAARHKPLLDMWPSPFDPTAWKLIGGFLGTQLMLMRVYKSNGFQCFALSIALFFALFFAGAYHWELYSGGVVYEHLPQIISAMNVFSYAFCDMLYVKGAFLRPSSSDSGTSGNPIFDFYWCTELYPRVLGWDVKLFTNCRGGMMFWDIAIISYACKQVELYGALSDSMAVSVGLQLVYIVKFFGGRQDTR
uniref:7-dehydrocholesterol reductase n=1 Tax=Globisporangium ultimum (strain ATCC 200006 / CBS 805.95 / DAOM BR144) TaxID=431595 RepID=K3W5T7_GLOUD